ncbi:MAG: hypothetical protein JWP85_982 [Rhodoglobus sp.]|nr:hypothetical protein [Rhodoglobus sp.]
MSRFQKIVIAILAALVLVVGIGVTVIITQQSQAAAQDAYERCLAAHGYTPGSLKDMDELDGAIAAADACAP